VTLLGSLVDGIATKSPLARPFLSRSVAGLSETELGELERYLAHGLERGQTMADLVEAYDLITKDTLREQMYFRRHGRYRFSRFDEVAASVYHAPEYMTRYMQGLALTSFLWPNHAAIRRWFDHTVLARGRGRYLEVGPGHGFYFMAAMRSGRFDAHLGVDISETSVALTRALVSSGAFGAFDGARWDLVRADFFEAELDGPFDALVMGEVLEHVEDPRRFLQRARALTKPDATLFVTTCIDSPAFDHIFHFDSVESVHAIARDAGLAVVEDLVLPYAGETLASSREKRLPINIALVLAHA